MTGTKVRALPYSPFQVRALVHDDLWGLVEITRLATIKEQSSDSRNMSGWLFS